MGFRSFVSLSIRGLIYALNNSVKRYKRANVSGLSEKRESTGMMFFIREVDEAY